MNNDDTKQELLDGEGLKDAVSLSKPYDKGFRNYLWIDPHSGIEYQVIRLSEGCPNGCEYCAEFKTINESQAQERLNFDGVQ